MGINFVSLSPMMIPADLDTYRRKVPTPAFQRKSQKNGSIIQSYRHHEGTNTM